MLKNDDFFKEEAGATLLRKNNGFLNEGSVKSLYETTRKWAKSLLDLDDIKSAEIKEETKSSKDSFLNKRCKYDEGMQRDIKRVFKTSKNQQILLDLMSLLSMSWGQYHQAMPYLAGFLLLFFDTETVFKMMNTLHGSTLYQMAGHWRSDALTQQLDALIIYEIVTSKDNALGRSLGEEGSLLINAIPKYIAGVSVQMMPIEALVKHLTNFFEYGYRYLLEFVLQTILTLKPLLISNDETKCASILSLNSEITFENILDHQMEKAENVGKKETMDMELVFFEKVINKASKMIIGWDLKIETGRIFVYNKYKLTRNMKSTLIMDIRPYEYESDQENEDDITEDCQLCPEGFADLYCNDCNKYICDGCHDQETGNHLISHSVKDLYED